MRGFAAEYRVALITGAGSGLGRAVTLALANEGVAIAALDLNAAALQTLADELKIKAQPCACASADVTDFAALQKTKAHLEDQLGPIDLMIASAGIGVETTAIDFNPRDVARVVEVNLIGVSNSIAAVLPGMLQRRRGHLVAISSIASVRGLPRMFGYCASKAGVNALMDGVRVELQGTGIAVTTICPGWVRTPMTEQIKMKLAGIMEANQAARHIMHAIRRKLRVHTFPRSLGWRMRAISWLPLSWQDRYLARVLAQLEAGS